MSHASPCCLTPRLVEIGGYVGQYHTTVRRLKDGERQQELNAWRGGRRNRRTGDRPPQLRLREANGRVVTQRELEQALQAQPPGKLELLTVAGTGRLRPFAMIQCVGSRDEDHPYCSRVCCSEAIEECPGNQTAQS
jgi:heterodisulfide reductase subunit A2